MSEPSHALKLAKILSEEFSKFPQVAAVALAGSQASGAADLTSDIDLYIYTTASLPFSQREPLIKRLGYSRANLNLNFWDPGDEWMDAGTGIEVDAMYWDTKWIEEMLDKVILKHQASMGYSTCFWNTIKKSHALFDRSGWFSNLKIKAEMPYPEELRDNIIRLNHAVLRRVIPSYANQIDKASKRGDWVSINHRVAALLASYFDVIFALNCELHPGEKRLIQVATKRCPILPENMAESVQEILKASASGSSNLMMHIIHLLDALDKIMVTQGYDPSTSEKISKPEK